MMNDHNDPSVADPDMALVNELLDGVVAGDPFADQVESLLNAAGGPVSVDDVDVGARADRVLAQIRGAKSATAPAPSHPAAASGTWRWVALAAAAVLAVGVWTGAPKTDTTSEVAPVELSIADQAAARPDTLVLEDGIASVHHTSDDGVHRVYLSEMDVTVEPIGTIYHTGVHGDIAVVWVEEGRVRLLQGADRHLGEVGAGGWAVLSSHEGDDGIQVDHLDDGPVDTDALHHDPAVTQLMAEVRWNALDADTRGAIVDGAHAP